MLRLDYEKSQYTSRKVKLINEQLSTAIVSNVVNESNLPLTYYARYCPKGTERREIVFQT